MVFTRLGLVAGPALLGIVDLPLQGPALRLLAVMTLVLVLFVDASRIHFATLRRGFQLPLRMLGIGLPLTIGLGTVGALFIFPGLEFWEAAALAAILAPTDAALGQAVVSSPRVPVRIRQALNVESGLNDGIALPVVIFVLSLASAVIHDGDARHWLVFAAKQLTLGPLVGLGVGFVGGKLLLWAGNRGYMTHIFKDLAVLGLAVLAWAGAEACEASGLIAAFVAGLTLGNVARPLCDCLYEFGETEGQLLVLFAFLAFGSGLVWPALMSLDWRMALYVGLSLTLIRMLPVAISLLGSRLRPLTVVFLAWFGPRGLASILFALLVLEEFPIPHREQVMAVAMVTVFASVWAHGLSAHPAAEWYARSMEGMEAKEWEEARQVTELPVRVPFRGRFRHKPPYS
jgi:NhaP-type Na+/H+ or K+/H+ antiporter